MSNTRPLLTLLALALALPLLPAASRAEGEGEAAAPPAKPPIGRALEVYAQRPQASYRWALEETLEGGGCRIFKLKLVSQRWEGREWSHRLNLIVPPPARAERARPGHALLLIAGSGREKKMLEYLPVLAGHIGAPVAVVHDVPNQPLFRAENQGKGLREDAAIAHTFLKFFASGDPEQLLLLPMARSAVAAMDALGEFSKQQGEGEQAWAFGTLDKFLVTGASKRGWTTWLSSVVDKRVIGIAPIVYDNLNLTAQINHHYEVWGAPSPSIGDYTARGLTGKGLAENPRARDLARVVDPYSYAKQLTVPKLTLIGTNDNYWPLDALNLYRADLPGELFVHYVPNKGHDAGLSVAWAIAGFFDHVTRRTPALPEIRLMLRPGQAKATIALGGQVQLEQIQGAQLWATRVPGTDFRQAKWTPSTAEEISPGRWEVTLPEAIASAPSGSGGFLAEVEFFDSQEATFTLHSPVQVWQLDKTQAN